MALWLGETVEQADTVELRRVKDMDSHILYAVVSIRIEMSRHLGLLCIMCYLVEVPLEPLFQTVPRSIVVSAVSNYHLVSLIPWGTV